MSAKLLSKKRILLLSVLLVAVSASLLHLQVGGNIRLPSEAEAALSSIREDAGPWLSRMGSSIFGDGSYFGEDLLHPSDSMGSGPTGHQFSLDPGEDLEEGQDQDGSAEVSDDTAYLPSISPIVEFNSSVSSTLFRTWGSLTLQGRSTLPYLILNATLWDGDRLVENTRYMMMEVEPGERRDFDIRERCLLTPERGYSSILEVEEPGGLFLPERRDCIIAEDGPKIVIWDDGRDLYGKEATPKAPSKEPLTLSRSADEAIASSKSTPVYRETAAYREILPHQETPVYRGVPINQGASVYRETPANIEAEESFEDLEYRYVGSKNSDKYHLPDCTSAKKIKDENRVYFSDVWEAREAGYSPCKACNPG
ncbi:Ada metal-binding domain-containing protein [Methanotrichaceae archaeon M04Ac]|uniref:Ada metal-binding domain-containing protein n=1 Tax=Candidatus Methanocrinis alkalitolerans TaxID=3033395 RepID=A0ABT5XDQ2_9EURY|nr:Ada metal-binding domain-containing protein [Candidatus Methanocrinis alkalitolerans]MDF0592845.1 Ada metal-binding domain-containing protein [Candidatus Methanocrinis alkalitolerans]